MKDIGKNRSISSVHNIQQITLVESPLILTEVILNMTNEAVSDRSKALCRDDREPTQLSKFYR